MTHFQNIDQAHNNNKMGFFLLRKRNALVKSHNYQNGHRLIECHNIVLQDGTKQTVLKFVKPDTALDEDDTFV